MYSHELVANDKEYRRTKYRRRNIILESVQNLKSDPINTSGEP